MNNWLESIFKGSAYVLTIISIIASVFFVVWSIVEITKSHYWHVILNIVSAGLCLAIALVAGLFIQKQPK